MNKIDRSLARLIRRRRKKIQVTNIRNERSDINIQYTGIKSTLISDILSKFNSVYLTT